MHPVRSLLCAALLAAVAHAQQAKAPLETRTFDISGLVRSLASAPYKVSDFGPVPSKWNAEALENPSQSSLSASEVVDLVCATIEPHSWEATGASISTYGGRLVARNLPGVLDRVQQVLDWLGAMAEPRVSVRADWFAFDAAGLARLRKRGLWDSLRAGVLGPRQVEALLEEGKGAAERGSGTANAASGQVVRIERTRSISYVCDYDVEIAQAAVCADPIVRRAQEGYRIYVAPTPLLSGRGVEISLLALFGSFRAPMRKVRLGGEELGTVELPDFDGTTLSTNLVATPGQAQACVLLHPGGAGGPAAGVLLLRVDEAPPPAVPFKGFPSVLDASTLARATRGFRIAPWDPGWNWRSEWPVLHQTDPVGPAVDPADVVDDVLAGKNSPSGTSSLTAGNRRLLFFHATPEVESAVRARLQGLERMAVHPLRLDVVAYAIPPDSVGSLLFGPAADRESILRALASSGAESLSGSHLPLLVGRPSCYLSGATSAYVADYDVQVAQKARIADPGVHLVFGGITQNARATLSPDGSSAVLHLTWTATSVDPGSLVRLVNPESPGAGVIQEPSRKRVRVDQDLAMPVGGADLLDAGRSADGRDLVLFVSLREG